MSSQASVPTLQPLLSWEITENGSAATLAAATTAVNFLRQSGPKNSANNLYTAFVRTLGLVDRPRAIEFGETFVLKLHDTRAIHSLVKLCLAEKRTERGLELLQMLEENDWHVAMRAKFAAIREGQSLVNRLDLLLGSENYVEQIAALGEELLAKTDDRLGALHVFFNTIRPLAKEDRRLTDLVLQYGELLAAEGHTSDQLAITICDTHLYKGAVDQALEALTRLAPNSNNIETKYQRVLAVKRLLDSGFEYEVTPTHSSYMPAPNRVLCPLHNSLPFDSGGYATRTHGLFSAIARKGWAVSGVTRIGYPQDRPKYRKTPYDPCSEIDGIRYFRLQRDGCILGGLPQYDYLCGYADELYELAKKERPAVIHAPANFMNGVAANAVAKTLGIKSIYEVRGLWEVTRISRQPEWNDTQYFNMMRKMELQAALDADAVVCITNALKEEMVERGVPAEKITIIPNGVDVDRFVPRTTNEQLKKTLGFSGKKVIGYIGSVVDYEGLDYLIEAAAALDKKGLDNFGVLIVGDGAALDDIKALAKSHGLVDRIVKFTGRVPHEQVEDYYSVVEIAPFPRKSMPVTEMVSPLKPFEAMAMNKIVLSSNVAALAEIVQDGVNGFLFEKDDVGDLTEKLEHLLTHGSETSMDPREWVITHRSWDRITEALDALYRSLTSSLEPVELLNLDEIDLAADIEGVLQKYTEILAAESPGHLRRDDYARWSYVSKMLRHETSLLDVGVGIGQFVNAMASRKSFERITGVDIRRHSRFQEVFPGFSMDYLSVANLPYANDEFDVVTCMETIEHIPDNIFEQGISELRRVCKQQLIITVPFREEKLSSGHLRRFDFADLERLFPKAEIKLFRKSHPTNGSSSYWALIEETHPRC